MITNVLQKPVGAMAVLAAAIGGPYAAFETDAGSMVRRILAGVSPQTPQPMDGDPTSLGLLNQPSGLQPLANGIGAAYSSYSNPSTSNSGYPSQPGLTGINSPSYSPPLNGGNYTSGSNPPGNSTSFGGSQSIPNNAYARQWPQSANQSPNMANGANMASGTPPQSSVVYGPATITPLGPYGSPLGFVPPQPMVGNYAATPQSQYANLETRQGPAQLVPGGTHQLWDYTVGVPSLQQLQRQPTAIGGGNVQDLREVLRFDVTPVWLTQRFSRVTTVLSNVQLDGMRVPLITGTQTTDLAGTLTYYFDSRQSVRRINLHGLTGDPSQLANLMVQFYGLKPEQSLGGQLYTFRWNNQVNSVLHLSPAPIVYSGADHSKFVVFLELNQADANMGLSQEASEILNNLQSTRRW